MCGGYDASNIDVQYVVSAEGTIDEYPRGGTTMTQTQIRYALQW